MCCGLLKFRIDKNLSSTCNLASIILFACVYKHLVNHALRVQYFYLTKPLGGTVELQAESCAVSISLKNDKYCAHVMWSKAVS